MSLIKKWEGDAAGTGDLTTSTVGTGDSVFDFVTKTGSAEILRQALTSMPNRPSNSSTVLVKQNSTGSDALFGWNILPIETYSLRFYAGVLGDVSTGPASLVSATSGGNRVWSIHRGMFGRIYLMVGPTTVGQTSYGSVDLGYWYRFEISCDEGFFRFRINGSNLPSVSINTTLSSTMIDKITFGVPSSTSSMDVRFDEFELRDTSEFIGPYVPGGSSPSQPDSWSIIEDGVEVPVTYVGVSNGVEIDTRPIVFEGVEDGVASFPYLYNVMGD